MTPTGSEVALVREIVENAARALSSVAADEAGNAVLHDVLRPLEATLATYFGSTSVLELVCSDRGIEWRDNLVLADEHDDARLAASLRKAGITGLTWIKGAEQEEVSTLLRLIDQSRKLVHGGTDDLALALFRADFHHISYTTGPKRSGSHIAESRDEVRTDPKPVARPDLLIEEVESEVGASSAPDVVRLEEFDSTLYFLDTKEIEYLRAEVESEYERDHAQSVLDMLLDMLEGDPGGTSRSEVLEALSGLLPHLLSTGDFRGVAYLTSELRRLNQKLDLEPGSRHVFDRLRGSVSNTGALAQLFHTLEGGTVDPSPEDLAALLGEMRYEAMQTVLVWVGQLEQPQARSNLQAAVELFFARWPKTLARMTTSTDRRVVHRALVIAKTLQKAEMSEAVAPAIHHESPGIRRLAIETLSSIGGAPAVRAIAQTLSDPEPEVRTAALVALTARPYRGAEADLRSAIFDGDLETKDVSERRALFVAFAAVTGPAGVPELERVLVGKGLRFRRPSSSTRACAARALGRIGTPAALQALRAVRTDRDPIVRSEATRFLDDRAAR